MFEIFKGEVSPSVADTIRINGVAEDLTGATVAFRMRPADASTLVVGKNATVVSAADGTVRYDWQAGDTDTAGDYMAWWHVTLAASEPQDTPEFPIHIVEHVPSDAFATSYDLATRLGVELTTDQHERATALLEIASDLIRDATQQAGVRQQISLVTNDAWETPGTTDDFLKLPQRPVVSVASITLDGQPLVEGADWYLDVNTIRRIPSISSVVVGGLIDEAFTFPLGTGFGWPAQTLAVTYTHGYTADQIPATVKAICLEAVVRVWVNPGTVAREKVGNTATVYDNNRFSPSGLNLTSEEKKTIRRLFGRTVKSITVDA